MPPVLDATVGGPNANSYLDVATADAYFANRLNTTAWDNATADQKAAALITATLRLDQEKYIGTKAASSQRLKWPRSGATDDDGNEFTSDAIPYSMKDATCEMALVLLAAGETDALAPTGLELFSALSAGEIELTLKESPTEEEKGGLPGQVLRLLRGLLTTYDVAQSLGYVRLKRS